MEEAASSLIAAVQQDPSSAHAARNYKLAVLCNDTCPHQAAPSATRPDLKLGNRFCEELRSHGLVDDNDLLCDSWLRQATLADEQAQRLCQAASFHRSLLTDRLKERDHSIRHAECEECAGALRGLCEECHGDDMPTLQLPRAWHGLRQVNLSALTRPVTVQDVRKALSHISGHESLSLGMRQQASGALDQGCVVSNFATAIGAMLDTSGRLWQWGAGGHALPQYHAVHGLKKCRAFCEPETVLMMTFLEVLCDRLFPEAAKSLNPLQRWRHKQEVWGNTDAVRSTIASLDRKRWKPQATGDVDTCNPFDKLAEQSRHEELLNSRVDQLQRMRLRLRQRFEFPLSHGFCYDGGSDAFAKLFGGVHAEITLCSAVHGGCTRKSSAESHRTKNGTCSSRGDQHENISCTSSEVSEGLEQNDFEVVEEALAVLRTDIQSFGDAVPHDLILHGLRSIGLGEDWLSFFKQYMALPLPSRRTRKRGLPLGPSLSTLLLEIVGCFLDSWLHNRLARTHKTWNPVGNAPKPPPSSISSRTPLLALLRCGDDAWLLSRVSDAPEVWKHVCELYSSCGLTLNMNESGSMILDGIARSSPPVEELTAAPCWSLLELTPLGTWQISGQRLAGRLSRAVAEVEMEGRSLLECIRVYNRHVDALLRQGGFHEHLRQALLPLHRSIKVLFEKAVGDYVSSPEVSLLPSDTALGSSLAPLLWWPRTSGGFGARHHLLVLHEAGSCLSARSPDEVAAYSCDMAKHFHRMSEVPPSRSSSYETWLRSVFGPLILDLFGTHTVLDERYTSLLS